MNPWLKLLVLLLLPWACHAEAAEGGQVRDELAGEQEAIQRPKARPTLSEPDAGGTVTLSRSSAGSGQPTFELPEFVITGGGERKAASRRPDLSTWMDTSGGLKASPSEDEASKSQVGSQAGRLSLGAVSETSRPAYGQARLLYGLANTLDADVFYGAERGPLYYFMRAGHSSTDGGPAAIPVKSINQSRQDLASLRGGWRFDDGATLGLELDGRWRDRLMTRNPSPAPRMERSQLAATLNWEGGPASALNQRARLYLDKAQVILPGRGTAYVEENVALTLDAEKDLMTRQSRTLVMGHAYVHDLCQLAGDRVVIFAGGWLTARFDTWSGARLSLGLGLDTASGGIDAFLLAPRVEFEQRLGLGLGVWARFAPRLSLPRLENGLFEKDPALPGTRNRPSRESINLEAGLSAALPRQLSLEIKGLLTQNEDGNFLDDPAGIGLWTATHVRGSRRSGAELALRAPLSEMLAARISMRWQQVELIDSPGLVATFAPSLEAEAWLEWKNGPVSAAVGAIFIEQRQGRLAGGDLMPATTDLRARAAYELNQWLSLVAEGRNLLSQQVQEFSGYADPSPYVGAGAELRF